jgi:hypothetical protein
MMRSTMHVWVHQCPQCGYCGGEVATASDAVKAFVRSDAFAQLRNDASLPELANRFILASRTAEIDGETMAAANDALHAAWDCDDNGNSAGAEHCRRRAAKLFASGEGAQQSPLATSLIDILRRCGDFAAAQAQADVAARIAQSDVERQVIEFQKTLIARESRDGFTVADAIGEESSPA